MNESNASLETSKQPTQSNSKTVNQETPNNGEEVVKPRTLAELFGNSEDESSTEINLDDNEPDDPKKPVDSLDRLMKRHGLTAEQVFAIKVPMPDGGETLTIGQLKDKAREYADFEQRETEFNDRRQRQEGELLKARQELQDLMATLPKDAIKPEVLASLRKRQSETLRRERQMALSVIPEWNNEDKRIKDMESMVEILGEYGFPESFIESIADHRALKLVRDFTLQTLRIRKSLEAVRNGNKKLGQKPSAKAKSNQKPVVSNGAGKRSSIPTQANRIEDWFKSKES